MRITHTKGITTDRIIAVVAILAAIAVGVMSWRQQARRCFRANARTILELEMIVTNHYARE